MSLETNTVNKQKVNLNAENKYITEDDLAGILESGTQVFSLASLEKYRLDIYKAMQENPEKVDELASQSKLEFQSLSRKIVLLKNGKSEDVFIKNSLNSNFDIQKGIPSKNAEDNFIHKKGKEEEGDEDEEQNDSSNNQNTQEENSEENNEENQEENEEEVELSEEELQVLQSVAEALKEGGDVEEYVSQSEPEETPEEIKTILTSLKDKGYIECEDEGAICNVTAITDKGQALIGGGNEEENAEQESNQEEGQQGQEEEEENQEGAGVEGGEQNNNSEEDTQNNQANQQEAPPTVHSEDDLKTFAQSTSDEDLQKFIQSPNVDDSHKKIAEEELARRSGQEMNENTENQEGNEDAPDAEQQSKDEFSNWVDEHFSSHDPEDLRDYTKKLILQSPSKIKELKEHYRQDYSKNNAGNSISKIDKAEFDTWLDQYLDHLPFTDLKDYANKLLKKDPRAFKDLKGRYEELKTNDML